MSKKETMNDFLKKQKTILSIAVFLIINALVIVFVIQPLMADISTASDKMQENITAHEINEKRIANIGELKEQFNLVLEGEKNLPVLFERSKAVALIEKIERIADITNNKVVIEIAEKSENTNEPTTRTEKKKSEEKGLVAELPDSNYLTMKINITGSYQSLFNFLLKLESIEYYSDVTGFEMRSMQTDNQEKNTMVEAPRNISSDQGVAENLLSEKNPEINSVINIVFYLAQE